MFDLGTHHENVYSKDRAILAFEICTFYCGFEVVILKIESQSTESIKALTSCRPKGIPYHAKLGYKY